MIDVMLANIKTSNEQAKFFKEVRPFQPVLTLQTDVTAINKMKDRLTEIGSTSGLWKVEKKLPPIEQIANAVGLKATKERPLVASQSSTHGLVSYNRRKTDDRISSTRQWCALLKRRVNSRCKFRKTEDRRSFLRRQLSKISATIVISRNT